jgi:DNA-binding response OmpR family regulator
VWKPPPLDIGGHAITVLSISPIPGDQDTLERILRPPQWNIHRAATLAAAIAQLKQHGPPMVLCQCHLGKETWRDVLHVTSLLVDPPFLIVTSRLADEYLWAEALNLGAYDVLAIPFDAMELTRTLSSAWLHWFDRHRDATSKSIAKAAS